MKASKESEVISMAARRYNISEREIRAEMQLAIDKAMTNDNFAKIFGRGVRPSPEDFIKIISDTVKHEAEKKRAY